MTTPSLERVQAEVPLPPGWKWTMVVGEPAVEGSGRTPMDEHSWLTWYGDCNEWEVRVIPPGYKNTVGCEALSIDTGTDDVVEAAKVLAGYVWMGMVPP